MHSISDNLFFLIINFLPIFILTVLIIDRIKQASKQNIYTAWGAYFIGTFFHELSHLLISFLMNGKPVNFSLLPQKDTHNPNNIILGYVLSSNIKWYNAIPISMSPLLLLVGVYFFDKYFFTYVSQNIYSMVIYLFLIISLIDSAIPSREDFRVAFSSFFGLFFYTLLISVIIFYFYKGF